MSASGEIRWPPLGRMPWPPTGVGAPPTLPDPPSTISLVRHVDLASRARARTDTGVRLAVPSAGVPLPGIPDAQPIALRATRSTIGQLQSRAGRQGRQCTATVVASSSKSVAVTAAHCVYLPAAVAGVPQPAADRGWVDETVFIPGVDGQEQPFGVWTVDKVLLDPRWQTAGDPVHDVALLRLAPRNGGKAQDALGAQGIGLAPARPTTALSAIGYPGQGRFTGDQAVRCRDDTPGVDDRLGGDYTQNCDMTEGSSGGPWVDRLDETTGLGVVVAVTSLKVVGDEQIAGARLDDAAMALFRQIDDDAQP